MPNCKTKIRFQDTPEKAAKLADAIERYRELQGALMPVLQAAQGIYGYLPEEVQIRIAEGLDIPLSEVYGVASFYSQFTLNPKGENRISVCLGTACYVKGAGEILEKVCELTHCKEGECSADGKFSVDAVRCIGACGLAPVLTIGDEVHGRLTLADVPGILEKYL